MRSFDALPQPQRRIQRLRAQQPQGQHAQQDVDHEGGPGAAHHAQRRHTRAAKGQPHRQGQLDRQRQHLQPAHQLRPAERLVERAEGTKQQCRRQAPAHHGQVLRRHRPQIGRHGGPAQQRPRVEQHRHPQQAGHRAQVQRLPRRWPDRRQLARPMQLGPDGQQPRQQAHQRHVDGDEHRRAHRQRGQRQVRVSPRDDGVDHGKTHHRQLPHQQRAGMGGHDSEVAASCCCGGNCRIHGAHCGSAPGAAGAGATPARQTLRAHPRRGALTAPAGADATSASRPRPAWPPAGRRRPSARPAAHVPARPGRRDRTASPGSPRRHPRAPPPAG